MRKTCAVWVFVFGPYMVEYRYCHNWSGVFFVQNDVQPIWEVISFIGDFLLRPKCGAAQQKKTA